MGSYKLSVVVLVYNTEQYLRECFDSLVNQTLDDIEIIIVNDESPDNSFMIIDEYHKKYRNIKVINQKNSGGAVAGNKGVQLAQGEYVTIMDSDDVVPLDAYEKMYHKAKEQDADIVIGKANVLVDGRLKEVVYKKERDVWKKERTIRNLYDYLDIFYDGFYWNKIYRREFILENDALMPPGMLYADRPMVHKAFLYAKKIEIIPDTVYFWRKRDNTSSQKSITQMKNDIRNFQDRIESLYYQIDYFHEFGDEKLTSEFLKRNVERLFFPINGILESNEFKEIYLKEVKKIFSMIDNIYVNELGITKNLYIYMILNDLTNELLYYLKENPNGRIIEEDGSYYWSLPFFRDDTIVIPDELFKITVLLSRFVSIEKLSLDENTLKIKNVSIPDVFHLEEVNVIIQSRHNVDDYYEFPFENYDELSIEIDISTLKNSDTYDVYLDLDYDGKNDKLRISKEMLSSNELKSDNDKHHLYFTKNNLLSILSKNIEIKSLSMGLKKIDLRINKLSNEEDISFLIRDRVYKESIYFYKINDEFYELKWKHFLEPNRTFDFYYKVNNKLFRMGAKDVELIKGKVGKIGTITFRTYITGKRNLSMISLDKFRAKMNRFRKLFKG